MGKYKRLGKNTILVFIGNIGSKLITFIMLPFYTLWLSVSDYGTTDLITVYVSFLLSIVTCCLAEAIFIFPKGESLEKQKQYFSSGIFISFISLFIAAILFYLLKFVFNSIGLDNTFTKYTWPIWGLITATFMQSYTQQFSRSIDKIKVYSISGIVLTGTTALFSFIFIPKYGLYGYIYSQIFSLIISALYTFAATKSYRYFSFRSISKVSYKEMLKYSVPLIPNAIMWWLIGALNRPVMEKYLGMDDVGIFAVANKFPSILIVLFSIFVYSWQIAVLEEFKKEGYKDFYNKMVRIIIFLLILVSCTMTVFSELIVKLAVDEKFSTASEYIPILSLAVIFSSLSGLVGTNFSAVRKSKYFFYSSVWGAAASIILSFVLIPLWGIYGTCLAIVFSHLVMAISRIIYSWKYVEIENIQVYIIMVLINVTLILLYKYCDNMVIKYLGSIIFFLLLIIINRVLMNEILQLYYKWRGKK